MARTITSLAHNNTPAWGGNKDKILADQPPSPKLTSDLGKEAQRLWEQVERAQAHQAQVERERAKVEADYLAANQRIKNAIDSEPETGTREPELQAKAEANKIVEENDVRDMNRRRNIAEQAVHNAFGVYQDHLDNNVVELLDELHGPAIDVAATYAAELAKFEKKVDSLKHEWNEIFASVQMLVGRTPPFREEDIPQDFSSPPWPTDDAMQAYHRLMNPPRDDEPEQAPEQEGERGVVSV
jgi:hypothetical protein